MTAINNTVTDIFVNADRRSSGDIALTALEAGKNGKLSKTQAAQAAQEFESMFLAQMLTALKPEQSDEGSLFNNKESDEIFNNMMMEEYAKEISKSGGIGIASYIERELLGERNINSPPRDIPAQWQKLMDNYQHTAEVPATKDQSI